MITTVSLLSTFADFAAGWCFWSLAHNLGHRWWHVEMREGKKTFYAHGEREHHRVYDGHTSGEFRHHEDPNEFFISFPLFMVAPTALLFIAAYGAIRGWSHALPIWHLAVCLHAD